MAEKKTPRVAKVSIPTVHDEMSVAGCLLVEPARAWQALADKGLSREHFTLAEALRPFSAVERLVGAGAPLDMRAIMSEGGITDAQANILVNVACICAQLPGLAARIILAYHRRQLKGLADGADSLEALRLAATKLVADLPSAGRSATALIPLANLSDPPEEQDNPAALFKNGWLRKGGGAILVAPSGVGKSVFTIQAATLWAMGKAAFGIEPVRPLRIAIIQAEDDAEEVAFFRNNIREGLAVVCGCERLAVDDAMKIGVRVTELVGATGEVFVSRLGDLLKEHPDVDLVIVNPFQSYFGGDVSHNAAVTEFLRAWLDPLIKPARAAVLFVHHTNRPPNAKERRGWGTDVFSAYVGAGGAELVNWARAVLALMPVEDVPGVFRLVAGKRGQRLGWKDNTGARTTQRLIVHHESLVFWREATDEETAAASGSVTSSMKSFDPVKDADKLAEALRVTAMQAPALRDYAEETFGRDRGRKAYKYLTEHLKGFMLSSSRAKHKGALFFGTLPDAEAAARNWDAEKGGV